MTSSSSSVRARRRRTLGAALSVCTLATVITIVGGAPAAEARSSGSMWYVGPNSPPEVANEVTYYGAPFGTSFYGLLIRLGYPSSRNGFILYDDQTGSVIAEYPAQWVPVADTEYTDSFSVDIPGATITRKFVQDSGNGGGPGIEITCSTNVCSQGLTAVQVSYTYSGTYRDKACVDAWNDGSLEDACPRQVLTGTQTRTVLPGSPVNDPPTSSFTALQSSTDPFEWSFESRSSDDQDGRGGLGHVWSFGDGATSTELNPTHRFTQAGDHRVTLTVTDTEGLSTTSFRDITIEEEGLVVNSTGDVSATDPTEGCDTGGTVGDPAVPECTLRAAIEAANADGGGEISFDINGGGTPSIALGSVLPSVTADTVIDGTSQDGGFVRLAGGGEDQVVLAGGTAEVRGMVFDEGETGISATGGSGHVIEGNRFGTDAAGLVAGDLDFAVLANGATGVIVRDNVMATEGPAAVVFEASSGTQITGNAIGVDVNRSAALDADGIGVLVVGPDTVVSGNTVASPVAGISVVGEAATGVRVDRNQVGVSGSGSTAFANQGYGIRLDGTTGTTVSGNRVVVGRSAGILASGSLQVGSEDDGETITYANPENPVEDQPVVGGTATIEGNTVGVLAGGAPGDGADVGIWLYEGMADSTVRANTVAAVDETGILVDGGTGTRVAANQVGVSGETVVEPVPQTGIEIVDSPAATVGGPDGDGNVVTASETGVDVGSGSGGVTVTGNEITGSGPDMTGIQVGNDAGLEVSANRLKGGDEGIAVGNGAKVQLNVVEDFSDVGIQAAGDDSEIRGNIVIENGAGIRVAGEGVTVAENRVGQRVASGAVVGNDGTGILVGAGDAEVTKNTVAGSGDDGISVQPGAEATMRANAVFDTTGTAILNPDGPDAPSLDALVRTTTGTSTRKTLVFTDLPQGDAGTIEVFANPTCSSGEARFVTKITRTKKADETFKVIQLPATSTRDHVTATYTDASGNTSGLSDCRSAATFADGDGDGSVDPFDGLGGFDQDPASAIVVTDDEDLLFVTTLTEGATLTGVGPVDDPAPGSHPEGWSLPYGAIRFRVEGIEPGGSAQVQLATLGGGDPIAGTTYWKYGPPTPGATPRWYLFDYDESTNTGARLGTAPTADGGFTRAFVLDLTDGGRGDSDGGANGTITDPGGPVIGGDTDPIDPGPDPIDPGPDPIDPGPDPIDPGPDPIDPGPDPMNPPTNPPSPDTPDTPSPDASDTPNPDASDTPNPDAPATGSAGTGTDTGPGSESANGPTTAPASGPLPRTGTDLGGPLALAFALIAFGAIAAGAGRRRRSRIRLGGS